ncbi:MAG: TIGR01620 family protein [Rhodobacter sp.]|nr:TIGR01620 family protein [Rhodobacter sp.]MCA3461398.1 TIGR01620 family protein [Rhodobacter sp.]MCA3464779.1 TIGR01620 family protein [Rhodobacter sp.]MCA3467752.1 TIGR01620 family protein [Rhodobacter sp.]MCA3471067.1 TIGR01620 family protein [Rhodobacter sp.]
MTDAPPLKPLLIERDEDPHAPTPASVPPVPDPDRPEVSARLPLPPGSALTRAALWVFGALFSFVLSVAAWDFVTDLLTRDSLLGTAALVLVGLAVVMALALALRELAGFARMARIDALRLRAVEAASTANIKEARSVVAGLESLYRGRPEFAPARARLTARGAEMFDADGLLSLAEAELMAPLDQSARREVEAAARQVATVTALVPLALADVAAALYANLRMIRRIAAIYGGRSGTLGSLRLMRGVFTHLAATGALAVGDDMIHSVAGGGILSRISRRFGEGVVNGALTARVGVAAMDVCRPLPFRALPRPKTTNLVSRGLAGLFAETRDS